MADYASLGYNQYLQKLESLAATRQKNVTSEQFAAHYELPLKTINYNNLTDSSRAYTAIVAKNRAEGGVFDDFQEAFNYVNSRGGGRILVQPGQYVVSKSLTIYSDTSLEGLSANDCILDFGTATNNLAVNTGASNVIIKTMTIQNSTNTNSAVWFPGGSYCQVQDCIFGTNTVRDVAASAATGIRVNRCRSQSSGIFYESIAATGYNEVSENAIYSSTSYAFRHVTQTRIRGNYIQDPGTTPFFGTFSFSNIDGNIFAGTFPVYAVDVGTATAITITNNYFASAVRIGTCSDVRIANNSIYTTRGTVHGIELIAAGTNTITGNRIEGGTQNNTDGIRLTGASVRNTITGNVINMAGGTPSYAVNIADTGGTRNAVVGNTLTGVSGTTNDAGSGNVIANNA